MSAFKVFGITVIAVLCGATVRAMDAESIRLVTWHHGETIEGEEFIAANEAIVDYLATLQHPTDLLKGIAYQCQAKSRVIYPSVQNLTGSQSNADVEVRMVYELSQCTAASSSR
jgi:hypothetical protein